MITENIDTPELLLHNDCISSFNTKLYSNIFTEANIVSKKKSLILSGNKFYGYFLEKGKESYFATDEFIKSLPFKAMETTEIDFKNDVFKVITSIQPVSIPSQKKMTFRKLVDTLPAFKHSNPLHFTLYKIVAIASYVDRVNFRVSTEAGFGKDSVVNIISNLVNSTTNLYGATFAKLEYVLYNKLIILNELGNLKKDDLINMQEFLLATGAYFNTYNKRTRKTQSTLETYDISKTSLVIFYNLPSYYVGRAQEYFDQMFTKAVINRFIPFVFDGVLTTSFEKIIDIDKLVKTYNNVYKDLIATITYYRDHPITEIKYPVDTNIIKFSKELNRYERSFLILLKWVAEYSATEEEFQTLSKELYKCYTSYGKLLH